MQKIIVVSASYVQRQLTEACLLAENYSVLCLDTAQQLEAEMAAGKPDLVLMDALLFGEDGFQACRKIKRNDRLKCLPVILCLESDTESEKYWAKLKGACGTLVKPLNKQDLLTIIRRNLPP